MLLKKASLAALCVVAMGGLALVYACGSKSSGNNNGGTPNTGEGGGTVPTPDTTPDSQSASPQQAVGLQDIATCMGIPLTDIAFDSGFDPAVAADWCARVAKAQASLKAGGNDQTDPITD